jgi:hypothetical protein
MPESRDEKPQPGLRAISVPGPEQSGNVESVRAFYTSSCAQEAVSKKRHLFYSAVTTVTVRNAYCAHRVSFAGSITQEKGEAA